MTKLRAEGFDVKELDLVSGFDVSDPEAWEHIGSVDLACLNAGVLTGSDDIAASRTSSTAARSASTSTASSTAFAGSTA